TLVPVQRLATGPAATRTGQDLRAEHAWPHRLHNFQGGLVAVRADGDWLRRRNHRGGKPTGLERGWPLRGTALQLWRRRAYQTLDPMSRASGAGSGGPAEDKTAATS